MIDPNGSVAELALDHPECAALLKRHREATRDEHEAASSGPPTG